METQNVTRRAGEHGDDRLRQHGDEPHGGGLAARRVTHRGRPQDTLQEEGGEGRHLHPLYAAARTGKVWQGWIRDGSGRLSKWVVKAGTW